MVTIPFYDDDTRALTSLILEFSNKNKIKSRVDKFINSRAGGNRENLRMELEKYIIFHYLIKILILKIFKIE